ncbi:hypothetical protein PAXRUDRAFT_376376 [Paxillus rubicundulus Ve08.2h10]|uniref:Uncharacterized protein n=1 Tax=Paxillus rubicundulus Ve08.2h10 TaxID=930991 RepID=A0A0D0DRE6_9AGAM|nr:hypothetical protein PAXRUDRAFT_376376 [Paxillus rubicundulus Ve08.2h10]
MCRSFSCSPPSMSGFGGSTRELSSFHFDFVHPVTGHPVNLPAGWKIYIMAGPTIGIPSTLTDHAEAEMKSMDECCGISRSDILPGEERYIAMEGTKFTVVSPSGESARFCLPLRVPVGWNPNQAMSFPSTEGPHPNSAATIGAV